MNGITVSYRCRIKTCSITGLIPRVRQGEGHAPPSDRATSTGVIADGNPGTPRRPDETAGDETRHPDRLRHPSIVGEVVAEPCGIP